MKTVEIVPGTRTAYRDRLETASERFSDLDLCCQAVARRDEEIERLRSRVKHWQVKAHNRAPNKFGTSGCACEIDEAGESIVVRCMAHRLDNDRAKIEVLELIQRIAMRDRDGVMAYHDAISVELAKLNAKAEG